MTTILFWDIDGTLLTTGNENSSQLKGKYLEEKKALNVGKRQLNN
ncbi:hypothetical protein [Okeania sp. SIO3B5]